MSVELVITALGEDRPGIVDELSSVLSKKQLNIEDSRMSELGGEFAILMLVSGSSSSIDDFIDEIQSLEDSLRMKLQVKLTRKKPESDNLAPYAVEVVSIDHLGIVQGRLNPQSLHLLLPLWVGIVEHQFCGFYPLRRQETPQQGPTHAAGADEAQPGHLGPLFLCLRH